MTDPTTQAAGLSLLRVALASVGTVLTTKGYADAATVQTAIGAILVLAAAAWGAYDKYLSERKTQAREVVAVNAGIAVADATPGKTPAASPAQAPLIIAAVQAQTAAEAVGVPTAPAPAQSPAVAPPAAPVAANPPTTESQP